MSERLAASVAAAGSICGVYDRSSSWLRPPDTRPVDEIRFPHLARVNPETVPQHHGKPSPGNRSISRFLTATCAGFTGQGDFRARELLAARGAGQACAQRRCSGKVVGT